jgi:ATP-binding cassette subfamily B protein RaxB
MASRSVAQRQDVNAMQSMQTMLNFNGRRRLPLILQSEAAECGLACLAMIVCHYGHQIDLNSLRRQHPISLKGATLRSLVQVAANLHLTCRALRFEIVHLHQLRLPAIVHWDMEHFVVLKSVTQKQIVIHDPADGVRCFSLKEASKHLTGIALEVVPAEGFSPKDERVRLPLATFWSGLGGGVQALVQVFVLSITLQILALAAPFYMQIVIDDVVAQGDADLLIVLALGFGVLMVISVIVSMLRSYIILILGSTLEFQMAVRLFRHLIRQPLSYFEKRHIGDVLSRFTSIHPIRDLLAEGLITAVIDGLMAMTTLVMLFMYDIQLTLVALIALALYTVLRLALYRVFRQQSEAVIQEDAKENSIFIETVRAIQSLKLFNRESERENQWLNRYAGVVNAKVKLGKSRICFATMNQIIFGFENIVVIYLAARFTLDGGMTVGMIFAFMSYKSQFTQKAALLVEQVLEFRLLDLHLERLADIALSPVEPGHDRSLASMGRPLQGRIELRNVCFRYAETEPLTLVDVNIVIEPGQFVTIMGPSGGGKTTLVKIMLGLLEPTSGDILIDGIPLRVLGSRLYREQVGAIMQEDQLLSGSIADNICFFDPTFDEDWMIECAQLAGIHDEIMIMPMAYNSLIGDMGSSLSGGQKQRVLLARALYKQPKILFLDEGTAHLDIDNERHINESLRRLNMTRISVAHRPEITNGADRILRIDPPRR